MSEPHSYDPRRWRRERWDEPGTIYFWSGRRGRFEAFSNFAPAPVTMPSWLEPERILTYATGEHAFQAAKAATPADHDRIRCAPTPLAAKRAGRSVALPADWERRRTHVMLTVVRAKFAAGELRELLLSTGEHILAEDSPYDDVWGCRDRRGGYRGANLLGSRADARPRRAARPIAACRATPRHRILSYGSAGPGRRRIAPCGCGEGGTGPHAGGPAESERRLR